MKSSSDFDGWDKIIFGEEILLTNLYETDMMDGEDVYHQTSVYLILGQMVHDHRLNSSNMRIRYIHCKKEAIEIITTICFVCCLFMRDL